MVWILSPINPSPGPSKYYFTSSGTYKVGRKDCTVIIQTDKTVSRLHAEIKVDYTDSRDFSKESANILRPLVILRDLSKFGSFVNKSVGSKPVFSLSNKEVILKEGDLITFGTDNCTFRLESLPLLVHIASLADKVRKDALGSAAISMGGCIVEEWSAECTHLVVEDGSYVTDVVIQAVAERKPVIGTGWIEAVVARSSPSSEFPSLSRFAPNLLWKLDGDAKLVKIAEPEIRVTAFKGFTLYIGSMYLYTYKELIQLLVEVSGGVIVFISDMPKHKEVQHQPNELLIVPSLEPKLQRWMSSEVLGLLHHLPRITEEKLIAVVLAGQIDNGSFELPASPVVSVSSDETIEAAHSDDGDDEIASSVQAPEEARIVASNLAIGTWEHSRSSDLKSGVHVDRGKISMIQQEDLPGLVGNQNDHTLSAKSSFISKEKFKGIQKHNPTSFSESLLERVNDKSIQNLESTENSKADILYSKDLIVDGAILVQADSSTNPQVQNFKRFKKRHDISGNSFATLVPFAKEPYRESDYGKEIQEYIQEEKKRKQAEALAEDLFNAEKLKRQKGATADVAMKLAAFSSQQKLPGKLKAR